MRLDSSEDIIKKRRQLEDILSDIRHEEGELERRLELYLYRNNTEKIKTEERLRIIREKSIPRKEKAISRLTRLLISSI